MIVSIQLLRDRMVWPTSVALRLAKIGLAGGVVSIVALALAGLVYAAGINPTGPAVGADRPADPGRRAGVRIHASG